MLKTSGCNQHLFGRVIQEAIKSSRVTNNTSFHTTQRHMSPLKGTSGLRGWKCFCGCFVPMSVSRNEREDDGRQRWKYCSVNQERGKEERCGGHRPPERG